MISNEVTTLKNVTHKEDHSIRTFRVKNFLKILPTYIILWERKVWGIPDSKCPRCNIEKETWEHIWTCSKNSVDISEYTLFDKSIDEIINSSNYDHDEESKRVFKNRILDVASKSSLIIQTENLIREVTRGLINEKWWITCSRKREKYCLILIFHCYMEKLRIEIWNKRCDDTIHLEKQLWITKDLKRKHKRAAFDEDESNDELEKT